VRFERNVSFVSVVFQALEVRLVSDISDADGHAFPLVGRGENRAVFHVHVQHVRKHGLVSVGERSLVDVFVIERVGGVPRRLRAFFSEIVEESAQMRACSDHCARFVFDSDCDAFFFRDADRLFEKIENALPGILESALAPKGESADDIAIESVSERGASAKNVVVFTNLFIGIDVAFVEWRRDGTDVERCGREDVFHFRDLVVCKFLRRRVPYAADFDARQFVMLSDIDSQLEILRDFIGERR
jgi:hypothetical protein